MLQKLNSFKPVKSLQQLPEFCCEESSQRENASRLCNHREESVESVSVEGSLGGVIRNWISS